jgi:Zn-dependent M28 family amino/carboxypeptidase
VAGGGVAVGLALTGCTATETGSSAPGSSTPGSTSASSTSPAPTVVARPGPRAPSPTPPASRPVLTGTPQPEFDAKDVLADIETLAGDIGPREATSKSFDEAAELVEKRFENLGYEVATESVQVPAGNSWGTPVRSGTSRNVIAGPEGFDDEEPHVVVVAHLDTVPVAPGAEDNASGISVMLELARMAAAVPPETPVRFIAFGAEEPRGTGDAWHHFGSQHHVDDLSKAERNAIRAVIALDRVGVRASYVPVCSAQAGGNDLRGDVRDAAKKVDVPTRSCAGNTTSDHWSYAKAGIPAIRLGSIPYAGYHSPDDTPDVVDRRQLDRVGNVIWAWLQSL